MNGVPPSCTVTASCEDDDHTLSWPCVYAPGSGSSWARMAADRCAYTTHIGEPCGPGCIFQQYPGDLPTLDAGVSW